MNDDKVSRSHQRNPATQTTGTRELNVERIRRDFKITSEYTNLDNASLSPTPTPVLDKVQEMLASRAQHGVEAFWDWVDITEATKGLIANLINASSEEIAFTQNTSEGINIVANMLDWRRGDNIVLNNLEFSPNYWPWLRHRKHGVEIRLVEHDKGLITPDDYAAKIDSNTRVVAISSVAWINGLKHDLRAIGELAHAAGAYLVVDAIQSVGVSPIDVQDGPIDFLSCGGHKWLFSLLGSGFFYCREELIEEFEPVYLGWQSDKEPFEYGFREFKLASTAQRFNHGNTSVAGHFALHAGIEYINSIGVENIERRNIALLDHLIDGLEGSGVEYLSPLDPDYRSSILNFIPEDCDRVIEEARERDILLAARGGGIRVSPNFYNTKDEMQELIDLVQELHH